MTGRTQTPRKYSSRGQGVRPPPYPTPDQGPRVTATFARTLVCAGFLLTGAPAFAADNVQGNQPVSQADREIEALLREVELQVSAGHAVSPAHDNAIETWKQVSRLVRSAPNSPVIRAALSDFVTRMGGHASEQKTAGKLMIAGDLTVFADQANRLLEDPVLASNLPADKPRSADLEHAAEGTASLPEVPKLAVPSTVPLAAAVPLPPPAQAGPRVAATEAPSVDRPGPTPNPPVAMDRAMHEPTDAVPAVADAAVRPNGDDPAAQPPGTMESYIRRGDEMLALKNIPAAREFYGYAAMTGSAIAAVALARTYDTAISVPAATVAASGKSAARHRRAWTRQMAVRPPVPWYTQLFNRIRTLTR
jgi:hypothetical protein